MQRLGDTGMPDNNAFTYIGIIDISLQYVYHCISLLNMELANQN